jgi:hypothetical protein
MLMFLYLDCVDVTLLNLLHMGHAQIAVERT